jgi:hypothetical protein
MIWGVPRPENRPEETFAEAVERLKREQPDDGRLPDGDHQGRVWQSPIASGCWTDDSGQSWRRRGGDPTAKRVERLVLDPDVRARYFYLWYEEREVPPADRAALWDAVKPYYTGRVSRTPGDSDHTDYDVGEFKNDTGQSLVIVEKSC